MKKLLLLVFIIYINISGFSQQINLKDPYNIKKETIRKKSIEYGIVFLSGMIYGYNQLDRHYYYKLKAKHPNISDHFWGKEQYLNKWKNRDPEQGEAFWGSSRWFVMFTDAHHSTMFAYDISLTSGVLIGNIGIKYDKWWQYLIEIAAVFVVKSVGFELIHSLIY